MMQRAALRRTATGIILAGYIFAVFRVSFGGVDLLIDAVGYLLVFNGAKALRKRNGKFAGAPVMALGLVVVAAIQMFALGMMALVLAMLRCVADVLLYLFLQRGYVADLAGDGWHWESGLFRVAFGVNALAQAAQLGALAAGRWPLAAVNTAALCAHAVWMLALLRVLLLSDDRGLSEPG